MPLGLWVLSSLRALKRWRRPTTKREKRRRLRVFRLISGLKPKELYIFVGEGEEGREEEGGERTNEACPNPKTPSLTLILFSLSSSPF